MPHIQKIKIKKSKYWWICIYKIKILKWQIMFTMGPHQYYALAKFQFLITSGKARMWNPVIRQWSCGSKSEPWGLGSNSGLLSILKSLTTLSEHLPPPTACAASPLHPLGHHPRSDHCSGSTPDTKHPDPFPSGRTQLHVTWWTKFPNRLLENL